MFVLLAAFYSSQCLAASCVWKGGPSGSWDDDRNWTKTLGPTSDDNVEIQDAVIRLDGPPFPGTVGFVGAQCLTLTIRGNVTLASSEADALHVGDHIYIEPGATLTLDLDKCLVSTLVNDGVFKLAKGRVQVSDILRKHNNINPITFASDVPPPIPSAKYSPGDVMNKGRIEVQSLPPPYPPPGTDSFFDFLRSAKIELGNIVILRNLVNSGTAAKIEFGPGAVDVYGDLIGDGPRNVGQAAPPYQNPSSGLKVNVHKSSGGLVQLDADLVTGRAFEDIVTDFEGIIQVFGRGGNHPLALAKKSGIAVANSTALKTVKGRRMIVIGADEIGMVLSVARPVSSALTAKKGKGKVSVSQSKLDRLDMEVAFELPGGFVPGAAHTLDIGLSNLVDRITLDPKGKASGGSIVVSAKVKFPKPARGQTALPAGAMATLRFVIDVQGAIAKGLESEGIDGAARNLSTFGVSRELQVALILDGVPYQGSIPVTVKSIAKGETLSINTGR